VLLVFFGTGPNVDVLGHLFGLLAGLAGGRPRRAGRCAGR
jgi:hypothetical protein